jgi:hypothetical protein
MRFLISVIDDNTNTATPGEMERIDSFNERLREAGHWILACGLAGPSTATVIDNRDGRGEVSQGPLLDSKEFMSGFWLIEAPDRDVAVALATEGSQCCNRKVEVRAFL